MNYLYKNVPHFTFPKSFPLQRSRGSLKDNISFFNVHTKTRTQTYLSNFPDTNSSTETMALNYHVCKKCWRSKGKPELEKYLKGLFSPEGRQIFQQMLHWGLNYKNAWGKKNPPNFLFLLEIFKFWYWKKILKNNLKIFSQEAVNIFKSDFF